MDPSEKAKPSQEVEQCKDKAGGEHRRQVSGQSKNRKLIKNIMENCVKRTLAKREGYGWGFDSEDLTGDWWKLCQLNVRGRNQTRNSLGQNGRRADSSYKQLVQ